MFILLFYHFQSYWKLVLLLRAKQRELHRVNESVVLVLELRLSSHLAILVVVLSPPGFWISGHVPSPFVHLHIILTLQTHSHIIELLLAIEHVPKEPLVYSTVRKLHHRLITFAALSIQELPGQRHCLIWKFLLPDSQIEVNFPAVPFCNGRPGLYFVIRLWLHTRQFGVIYVFIDDFVVAHVEFVIIKEIFSEFSFLFRNRN